MKKPILFLSLLVLTLLSFSSLQAQTGTVATFPPFVSNNGSSGISFEVSSTVPIEITDIYNTFSGGTSIDIWIKPGGITTTTPPLTVSTANGWTLIQTGLSAAATNPTPSQIIGLVPIPVAANTPLGIVIAGPGTSYMTWNATVPSSFTDGTVTLFAGGTKGFGGVVPSFGNFPRGFVGSIDYSIVNRGLNDAGVASVGPPGAFCPGVQNIDATIKNYGTNAISSATVNWALDGVVQTPISLSANLDTLGGSGQNDTTITLGTTNFILSQSYTIEAWTTMPNGVVDTTTFNDSATTTLVVTVPGVNSLGASNIIDVAADINWTELGTASQWQVELGLSGFVQGTGSKFFTINNPHSLSGLTQNTAYDFYVRSICGPGDTSSWSGVGSFLTTCAISSAPFYENFDGAFWIGPGVGSIDQCWSRNNTITPYWQVDNNGTSSSTTGPAMDASGVGNYLYLETSGGSLGDSGVLESPWIDLSSTTTPELSFEYHMFGATMGTLKAQMSSDGTNWTTVYTKTGPQHFADNEPWLKAIVPVLAYAADTVKIRFVGIRGSSFTGDMAIDEVRLRQPPQYDLGMVAIDSPITECGIIGNETVTMRFVSLGWDTITTSMSLGMNYSVNGGAYVTESLTPSSDIHYGDTISYSFTTQASMGTPGNYNFKAFAFVAGDGDPINDTLEKLVVNIPVITGFPYFQNFESGQGGWISDGVNNSWAYGTPAKNTINSASSGTKAWVTGGLAPGGYNTNEASYITGPCYDMTSITSPIMKLDIWWSSDFSWDGTQIQSSTDGGATWSMVGNFGDPENWYNDNTVNGLVNAGYPGEGWSGNGVTGSGGWVTAKHNLTGLGGNSAVLLRVFFGSQFGNFFDGVGIDNITVLETPNRDVGLTSIDTVQTGCALGTSETIAITYSNFGIDTLVSGDTIPFSYDINGGSSVTENFILSSSLFPGDTTFYVFATGANLGTFGQYDIKAWSGLSGDQDPSNDTLFKTITNVPVITSFPYIENFESGQGGWTSGGNSSTWAYGTPAKSVINSASSGLNAWVTGGLTTGNYNNNEASFVSGPCFDMSGLVLPIIKADIWWDSEFSWDGVQLQASTNGGSTWTQIGNFGDPDNWYNDNTINGIQGAGFVGEGWTGNNASGSGGWVTAKHGMAGLGGNSDVFVRMFFGSDGSVNGFNGFSFDDIVILETPTKDLSIMSIDSSTTGCALGSSETVAVTYANLGIGTLGIGDSIFFGYNINGTGTVSELLIVSVPILPGDTTFYVFNTTADLSAFGAYSIKAWTALPGDQDPSNDTIISPITNVPVISTFPYLENFDTGPGGWTSSGANSTWAHGTIAKSTITSASSGTDGWVTGGLGAGNYNNGEASFVTGPCFDFTSVVRPGFDMKVWWDSEFSWDGARLEATSNAGVTWDVIGNFGDPNNWYTDNSINGMPFGQQEGWSGTGVSGSGGWVTASNIEINFGGQSDVFLRIGFYSDGSVNGFDGFAFDDFGLSEDALAIDVQMDSIVPINSNCGLSATTPVTVIVTNYGQNTLTNIPVTYYIGGVPMATEIITNSLVGGQVFPYQFNQTADLSNPQGYILTASVDYVGDMDSTNNNSPPMSVVSYQVPSITTFMGDEVCGNGPVNLFADTDIGVTRWYDAASGGTLLLTADNFPISNLTSTTTYYAEPFSPSIIPCVGIRQPVLAEVSQIPTINFTGLQTASLTVQFTSTLSSNTDSVWWDFGDFSVGTDDPNPIHVYPSSGTKAVILQGFDGSCDTAVTNAIFVLGLENGLAGLIEIFPNPTAGSFQFKADDLGESINIQLLDQKGVIMLEENWKSDNGKYDRRVDLSKELSAGTYHLRIVSGDRIGRIKIVKE